MISFEVVDAIDEVLSNGNADPFQHRFTGRENLELT